MTVYLDDLGKNLAQIRKKKFPFDTMAAFATRCEIGLSTYKKMEKGDLSVGMYQYYKASSVLGIESEFDNLFKIEDDWFND
ncbi:helix-turn-helix domain-containing protein [Aliikangiella coralliicola]|uniref:Helix-turn-helix transcriptional regulator n=1 Tax=Aliikangiella coralliicola TaxID=2592383 RepID=A0A545UJU8_9GAMM|nr:hypothetical protein [Aliikangiella coralliicola]TQV89742.1 hypothetical protein FLL46_02355 [Aliikangiella coralliicola]